MDKIDFLAVLTGRRDERMMNDLTGQRFGRLTVSRKQQKSEQSRKKSCLEISLNGILNTSRKVEKYPEQ